MNILSLFDGISCARVALDRADIKVNKYYASEIDKYAISVSRKQHPEIEQVGSVTELKGEDFKDIDLIIGGSPCQDLSIAKQGREGLKGSRSGLFYDMLRLINDIKPKYFVLENVNSMPKAAKEAITEELFGIEPIMINAALVSAQNRKRLFWIGELVGDTYEKVNIELPEDKGIMLRDILESEVEEKYYVTLSDRWDTSRLSEATVGYNPYSNAPIDKKSRALNTGCGSATTKNATLIKTVRIGQIGKGGQGDRIYSKEGNSVALSANGGGRGAKTGLYEVDEDTPVLVKNAGKDIIKELDKAVTLRARDYKGFDNYGSTAVISGAASRTYPRTPNGQPREKRIELRKDDKANSMTSVQGDSMVKENNAIRKLTPIECERLQSLPSNYTAKGITEKGEVDISNSQRYKTLGNAFNVDVVTHILTYLK